MPGASPTLAAQHAEASATVSDSATHTRSMRQTAR